MLVLWLLLFAIVSSYAAPVTKTYGVEDLCDHSSLEKYGPSFTSYNPPTYGLDESSMVRLPFMTYPFSSVFEQTVTLYPISDKHAPFHNVYILFIKTHGLFVMKYTPIIYKFGHPFYPPLVGKFGPNLYRYIPFAVWYAEILPMYPSINMYDPIDGRYDSVINEYPFVERYAPFINTYPFEEVVHEPSIANDYATDVYRETPVVKKLSILSGMSSPVVDESLVEKIVPSSDMWNPVADKSHVLDKFVEKNAPITNKYRYPIVDKYVHITYEPSSIKEYKPVLDESFPAVDEYASAFDKEPPINDYTPDFNQHAPVNHYPSEVKSVVNHPIPDKSLPIVDEFTTGFDHVPLGEHYTNFESHPVSNEYPSISDKSTPFVETYADY